MVYKFIVIALLFFLGGMNFNIFLAEHDEKHIPNLCSALFCVVVGIMNIIVLIQMF